MSDIAKINDELMILISSGIALGKPFSKEIFLTGTHIAGTTHVENIQNIADKLTKGKKLSFFREPENPYDKMAIVVKDDEGNKVGYIPRLKNEIIARLMDAGKLIYGIVKTIDVVNDWIKIDMEIYLKD